MSNDRSDILVCRDCGIVIRILIHPEHYFRLRVGDVLLLDRCKNCKK
jgi:hypothetical protein